MSPYVDICHNYGQRIRKYLSTFICRQQRTLPRKNTRKQVIQHRSQRTQVEIAEIRQQPASNEVVQAVTKSDSSHHTSS